MTQDKCEIHDEVLNKDKLPITYGLVYFDEDYLEAQAKLFPFSNSYVLGGCIFGEGGDSGEVLFCEQCRKAEAYWIHKGK